MRAAIGTLGSIIKVPSPNGTWCPVRIENKLHQHIDGPKQHYRHTAESGILIKKAALSHSPTTVMIIATLQNHKSPRGEAGGVARHQESGPRGHKNF